MIMVTEADAELRYYNFIFIIPARLHEFVRPCLVNYPSGQRGLTVNQVALPS